MLADSTPATHPPSFAIEPADGSPAPGDAAAFIAWFAAEREPLEERLLAHGAVLFHDTGLGSPGSFARFLQAISPALLDYVDGNSPRTRISRGMYTSTEYPAPYFISLHNELSYSHSWPAKLFFCCVTAAPSGGETVIADSRDILRRLDPGLVAEFRRRGVMYVRNLHGGDGLGPSWQDTFETTDRQEVERYCASADMAFEWRGDGRLRVSQVRPAVIHHPRTGEEVWFNQADQFHPSTHPPEIAEALLSVYQDVHDLPQNAFFGDGGALDPASLEAVRAAARAAMVPVAWREDDLLMVDNVLAAHGRMPFTGPRKILVAMS